MKKRIKSIAITCIVLSLLSALLSCSKKASVQAMFKAEDFEVGDSIFFGSYEQDNSVSNGNEEIEWIVLGKDYNKALLISKYVLDCKPYDLVDNSNSCSWETCSLRKWLNGDFIAAAFNNVEQAVILDSVITEYENLAPEGTPPPDDAIIDRVFILNEREVTTYFQSLESQNCFPTEFAIAQGADYTDKGCYWWLRSSKGWFKAGDGKSLAPGISGVRPAIWIKIVPPDSSQN